MAIHGFLNEGYCQPTTGGGKTLLASPGMNLQFVEPYRTIEP